MVDESLPEPVELSFEELFAAARAFAEHGVEGAKLLQAASRHRPAAMASGQDQRANGPGCGAKTPEFGTIRSIGTPLLEMRSARPCGQASPDFRGTK